MQIKLSRGEYWILESLISIKYPVCDYSSPDHEAIFNRPTHGLDHAELLDTLDAMVRSGWISAHWWDMLPDHDPETAPFAPTRKEIEAALVAPRLDSLRHPSERPPLMYAELTALGGSVWESFACPTWDAFMDVDLGMNGPGEFVAVQKWRLEKYLLHAHYLGTLIRLDTLQWDVISPWQATYWKTLPVGHRVRFENQQDHSIPNWDLIPSACSRLQKWYCWSSA